MTDTGTPLDAKLAALIRAAGAFTDTYASEMARRGSEFARAINASLEAQRERRAGD